jgi:hypothetical protein
VRESLTGGQLSIPPNLPNAFSFGETNMLGRPKTSHWSLISTGFALIAGTIGMGCRTRPVDQEPVVTKFTWRGWTDAVRIANPLSEVIIVPSIGRVMSFSFTGEPGPFWTQSSLDGHPVNPTAREWVNFGGDKSWPAPQSDWERMTGRAWPPPVAFDSAAYTARFGRAGVTLLSPVDSRYGIRVERVIKLHPSRPQLEVVTTYIKEEGAPVTASVWVITQLEHPEATFVPVPSNTQDGAGYNLQGAPLGTFLELTPRLVAVRRDPKSSHKIGSDAGVLIWVGSRSCLRIDAPRQAGGEYPDNGSSVEIYTNPDPLPYVELETLGPLRRLVSGDRLSATNVYTLSRRSHGTSENVARAMLGLER